MVLSVSKLALVSLIIGLVIISLSERRFAIVLAACGLFFAAIISVMQHYGLLSAFNRLISATGHYELLVETLVIMQQGDLILGEGIGSVPYGSFHRFLLSRLYESGTVGLIFVGFVTLTPFALLFFKPTSAASRRITTVGAGVMCAVVFGLHAYDYFIHLFPWMVTGAVLSFHSSESAAERLRRAWAVREFTRMPRPTVMAPQL
jgi:hypothetical protein